MPAPPSIAHWLGTHDRDREGGEVQMIIYSPKFFLVRPNFAPPNPILRPPFQLRPGAAAPHSLRHCFCLIVLVLRCRHLVRIWLSFIYIILLIDNIG